MRDVNAIRQEVNRLLRRAWQLRDSVWSDPTDRLPIPVRPLITSVLELTLEEPEEISNPAPRLGSGMVSAKLGGYCDRSTRTIGIAQSLTLPVQRFTAAHEIGHWLMHQSTVSFRDLPLQGAERTNPKRSPVEREADLFAAELLMPETTIREAFAASFGEPLRLSSVDEDIAFSLRIAAGRDIAVQELLTKGPRLFAMLVSQTALFRGRTFIPLTALFGVSATAMAIQLMELRLVTAR
jgi:uncharacterized protein DUF955